MNTAEILEQLEKMSAEEKQSLLETQFPEELEKQAEAELDTTLLVDSLYNYGWLQAQRSLADVDGLDKVAADDLKAHEQAEAACSEQIEACLGSLQTHLSDDPVQIHKEAQVAAAIIFDGYSDCLEDFMEKDAAWHSKITDMAKSVGGKIKGAAGEATEFAKHHAGRAADAAKKPFARGVGGKPHGVARRAMGMVKKHRGKAGALTGAAVGAGLYKGYHAMKKESGALTEEQILDLASDMALEKQAMINSVADGIEKLAAKGESKGKKMKEMLVKASKSSKSSKSS